MVYALGLGLVPANRRQSTVQALLDSRVNTTNFVVDAFGAWLIGDLVPYGCGEEVRCAVMHCEGCDLGNGYPNVVCVPLLRGRV
jgi:hypothetical protein